jgi:O-antigen/teichoic acid export membrane protein
MVVLLALPVLIFVVLSSRSVLSLLYGSRYISASAALTAAALVAVINLVNALLTIIFYGTGRPQLHRRCVFIMASMMLIFIYPAVRYFGFVGAQMAALIAVAAGYLSQIVDMRRLWHLDLARYGESIPRVLLVSCALLLTFAAIRHLLLRSGPIPNLLFGAAASILVFAVCCKMLHRQVTART